MGKDTSAYEGNAVEQSIVKAHEKIKPVDGLEQDKAKHFKKKGTKERRRRSKSAKQAELDAMPVIPPLVVEAALLHQAKDEAASVTESNDNINSGASQIQATQEATQATVEKSELVQEDELPDFDNKDELPDFEIVNAPIAYGMEEAALHQRAKALGLPDSLEPRTPMAQENMQLDGAEMKSEAMLPVLQEAAVHQRAKALGLPDDAAEFSPATPQVSPSSQLQRSLPVLPVEEVQDGALHRRQDAIALAPNEDPLVALDSEVVTLHIAHEGKAETLKEKFVEKVEVVKAKLIERRNSLEEAGHAARLKIDAALERKFGVQAEIIQEEIEKARLSAISDTARIAELLQVQVKHCASELRNQQQEIMLTADPVLDQNPFMDYKEIPLAEDKGAIQPEGENVVAQGIIEAQQGLEENAHHVREKIDGALEKKFGNKVEKLQIEAERAREGAIDETARAAELIQQELGKCASSFREQLQSGIVPNYR